MCTSSTKYKYNSLADQPPDLGLDRYLPLLVQPLQLLHLHDALNLDPLGDDPFARLGDGEIVTLLRGSTERFERLEFDQAVVVRVGTVEDERFFERDRRVGDDPGDTGVVVRSRMEHERVDEDDL
jgi:hypothetical protein